MWDWKFGKGSTDGKSVSSSLSNFWVLWNEGKTEKEDVWWGFDRGRTLPLPSVPVSIPEKKITNTLLWAFWEIQELGGRHMTHLFWFSLTTDLSYCYSSTGVEDWQGRRQGTRELEKML